MPFPLFRRIAACALLLTVASATVCAQNYATPYTTTTFAGNPNDSVGGGSGNGIGTAAGFYLPQGIAVDINGYLYVSDTQNNTIRIITPAASVSPPAGQVSTLAGQVGISGSADGPASTNALFRGPTGIAVDSAGDIYVADTGNGTIRKISSGTGTLTSSTLAGLAGQYGTVDGTGSAARFAYPVGLALDSAGNIYVADSGAKTIRKVTPAGAVTTIAGTAAVTGHADGPALSATFNDPTGVAVDSAGNVYIADSLNATIRLLSGGNVSTIAGVAGTPGFADGTGTAARFNKPLGISVDAAGNLYVADTFNYTIRRIAAGTWVVTTLCGNPTVAYGSTDGTGSSALFSYPYALVAVPGGPLFIADTDNNTIREATGPLEITTQPQSQISVVGGSVTFTVAASGGATGYQWDLNGAAISGATSSSYTVSPVSSANAGPSKSYTVVVTGGSGTVTSNAATITISNDTPPTITNPNPSSQTVNAGATATLSVTGTGGDLIYTWYLNGTPVAGATGATLTLANIGTEQAGYYTAGVANGAGSAFTSASAAVSVNQSARLINISARAAIGTGNNILIAGYNIGGTGAKNLLLRGVGPGLANVSSLTGLIAAPQLTLFDNNSVEIVSDAGWGNAFTYGTSPVGVSPQAATATFMNSVGAFNLNTGSTDSAMEVSPAAGGYTAEVAGVGGVTGIGLAEIYDADSLSASARLVNLSARADVGVGNNILIGGFAIHGSTSETVLIRAVGPGLTSQGVAGVLSVPHLSVVDGNNNVIAANIGWGSAPTSGSSPVSAGIQPATNPLMVGAGAFALTAGSADCAMIVTLPPGNYTAEVTGANASSGVALVEIYEVP